MRTRNQGLGSYWENLVILGPSPKIVYNVCSTGIFPYTAINDRLHYQKCADVYSHILIWSWTLRCKCTQAISLCWDVWNFWCRKSAWYLLWLGFHVNLMKMTREIWTLLLPYTLQNTYWRCISSDWHLSVISETWECILKKANCVTRKKDKEYLWSAGTIKMWLHQNSCCVTLLKKSSLQKTRYFCWWIYSPLHSISFLWSVLLWTYYSDLVMWAIKCDL